MNQKMRQILPVSAIIAGGACFLTAFSASASEEKGPPATYTIVGDQIVTSVTSSNSTNYETIDSIKVVGTEAGVQSSTDYSIEVSNNIITDPGSSSVEHWADMEN